MNLAICGNTRPKSSISPSAKQGSAARSSAPVITTASKIATAKPATLGGTDETVTAGQSPNKNNDNQRLDDLDHGDFGRLPEPFKDRYRGFSK